MDVEWDTAKAVRNLQKHRISFEDAALVFFHHGRIEAYDGREGYEEDRWLTIGLAHSALLYVVYTVRHEDTIRIIFARKANADERAQYRKTNSGPNKPPRLSTKQKARLEAVSSLPDERIDYSDAPVLPDAKWVKSADRLPEAKKQITLRIDAEVLAFFKDSGSRYQSRMNAVLRSYVEACKRQVK